MIQKLLCLVFVVFAASACVHSQKIAKDFTGVTTDGGEFSLSKALEDKYVLLNFTATNCGYCWLIYPYLIKAQNDYKDKLTVVCVHNSDSDTHESWVKKGKSTSGDRVDMILDNELLTVWKASYLIEDYSDPRKDGWPHFFLINQEGKVVKQWHGGNAKRLIRNLEREFSK